jgi:hypothetical protein
MLRLIKHTESFVEDDESLCIQVLQHLRNMVERDVRFGRKVRFHKVFFSDKIACDQFKSSFAWYYVNTLGDHF